MPQSNPWVGRFKGLTSIEKIRERARVPARPLTGLQKVSTQEACDLIRGEWARLYCPGEQECHAIKDLIERSLSHAKKAYPTRAFVLTRCLAETFKAVERYFPVCITGLAGVGKSALFEAIGRVLPADGSVSVGQEYMPFPLVSSSLFKVEGQTSPGEVLRGLAGAGLYENGVGFGKAQIACARHFYVTGRCLAMIDEVQFMTQSDSATSMITKALFAMTYLGTPCAYGANFSLCDRLKRRWKSEIKRRFLTSPIVLVPDLPDSLDWKSYLQELERAVPGVYSFQFIDRARDLWFLSAGIKAHLQELLLAAYEQAYERGRGRARGRKWKVVSWEMVIEAYRSAKFSATREEVEQLIAYSATGNEPSKDFEDLICPFKSEREVAYRKSLAEAYLKPLGEALTHASLSPGEACALADVKKDAREKQRVAGNKVHKRSAAGLLANAASVLAPKRARTP